MVYGAVSLEKRIKENIKNYKPANLFPVELLERYFQDFAGVSNVALLLTDRHGECVISIGDFDDFTPDVVNDPGTKIRVMNRTIAHLYVKFLEMEDGKSSKSKQLVQSMTDMLSIWGEQSYLQREHAVYVREVVAIAETEATELRWEEREDVLTGVFNKSYFEERMNRIERSGVVPLGVVHANINDWKFVNDHFGDEESDRLIQILAKILRVEAKQDYIIGRTDGDVFNILIPLATEEEAEDYCQRVQAKSNAYEDLVLAPSIAMGSVIRTNVEENLKQLMSDAEYEMFQNKFDMKNTSGYQVRLQKGI